MRPRPDIIHGKTYKITTGSGAMFVTVNEDDQGLFEVFITIGKSGGYVQSFTESIGRLASLCLRSGVPVEEVIKQLIGIRGPRPAMDNREMIWSVPHGIGTVLLRHTGKSPAVLDSIDEDPTQDDDSPSGPTPPAPPTAPPPGAATQQGGGLNVLPDVPPLLPGGEGNVSALRERAGTGGLT